MPSYTAFGVCIGSTLPLPGLQPGSGRVDVVVRVRPLSVGRAIRRETVSVAPQETRFSWRNAGVFTIRGGREILVEQERAADPRLLQAGIVGPAMAALLQQRGVLVLHASVVAKDGSAVAFLGVSGSGKSTMAATMHARGFDFVSDDVAPVVLTRHGASVHAGIPQCKLLPDALTALGEDPTKLPIADPEDGKRLRRATGPGTLQPLPLAGLYVLGIGNRIAIEPLRASECFLELVRHSYGVEWMHGTTGPEQFALRSELSRRIPIRRLVRPRDLGQLSLAADAVEHDELTAR